MKRIRPFSFFVAQAIDNRFFGGSMPWVSPRVSALKNCISSPCGNGYFSAMSAILKCDDFVVFEAAAHESRF
ncbi:MAG: hypothetical protein WCS94_00570 [Verrucomicrobiota bacterium]